MLIFLNKKNFRLKIIAYIMCCVFFSCNNRSNSQKKNSLINQVAINDKANEDVEPYLIIQDDPYKAFGYLRACSDIENSAKNYLESIKYFKKDNGGNLTEELKREEGSLSLKDAYLRCVYYMSEAYSRRYCSEIFGCMENITKANCMKKAKDTYKKFQDKKIQFASICLPQGDEDATGELSKNFAECSKSGFAAENVVVGRESVNCKDVCKANYSCSLMFPASDIH